VEKYARALACPTKIRRSIERFAVEHLQSPSHSVKRQGEIHTRIESNFNFILNQLKNNVLRLKSLSKKNNKTVIETEFPKACLELKQNVPDSIKDVKVEQQLLHIQNESAIPKMFLHSLRELAGLENVTAARILWEEQCSSKNKPESIWNGTSRNYLNLVEMAVLEYLSYDKILSDMRKDARNFNTLSEEEYLRDTILRMKFFGKSKDIITDKYKKCQTVIYFSDDEEIKSIRSNLMNISQGIPFYEMTHRYCSSLGKLYNEVSQVDEHTVGVQPPTDTCIPETKDFDSYISNLVTNKKGGMAYVAKTLFQEFRNVSPSDLFD